MKRAFYSDQIPRLALIALFFALLIPLSGAPGRAQETGMRNDAFFMDSWNKFSGICDDAAPYVIAESRKDKSFFDVITLREPKYTRLLREAQVALGVSEATPDFEAVDALRGKNKELENEITALKRARISAPESSYNPLTKTKSGIDKAIADKTGKIAANEKEIAAAKGRLLDILGKRGLSLDERELDYFLISAEGDELFRLMTMADNMKRVQEIIEEELRNEPKNADLARIYTGMYLVSLDAYSEAHDTAIRHIGEYRERLKEIAAEAKKNYNEAKRLRRQASEDESRHIEANINLNQRAIETAKSYDSLLQRRGGNLEKSKKALSRKTDLARNTYRTLSNGAALITLVNDGSKEYALVMSFEMPELKNIYDSGMLEAFEEISGKIKDEK